MSHDVTILSPEQTWNRREELGEIYRQAFASSAEQAEIFINQSLIHVMERDGATVLVTMEHERILGFLYGYTFQRGNWWPDRVAPAIEGVGRADVMKSAFELVELAVLPSHQSWGIDSTLLSHQMAHQPQEYILLSTGAEPENRASSLYFRHGFEVIVSFLTYAQGSPPAQIMAAQTGLNSTKC